MILVTGASTGIGFATAVALADKGYKVLAGYRREEDAQKLIRKNITPFKLDVTLEADIQNLSTYLQSIQATNALTAIVNNAGIVSAGPLEFLPIEEIKKTFEVNVWGLMRVTQVCLPFLRQTRGKVINISSISGRTVTPFLGPYNASKYAVEVFTDAMRMEMLDTGVQFVLIEPGSIDTPIWGKSEGAWRALLNKLPQETFNFYGTLLKKFEKLVQAISSNAAPAETVVKKIVLAIEKDKPCHRYLVGRDAKIALIQTFLPSRLRDKLLMKMINSQKI